MDGKDGAGGGVCGEETDGGGREEGRGAPCGNGGGGGAAGEGGGRKGATAMAEGWVEVMVGVACM